MTNLFDLTGKVALITGGTHGLGMAMAKALGDAGATLVINGHTPAKMTAAMEEYKAGGYKAYEFLFDVILSYSFKSYGCKQTKCYH